MCAILRIRHLVAIFTCTHFTSLDSDIVRISCVSHDRTLFFFFFQAEDGIRDYKVTGVQTCALPIFLEQYKLYVEMADRISSRRLTANSFFLTINSAIIALGGYAALRFGEPAPSS